jgi:hypothetical protein
MKLHGIALLALVIGSGCGTEVGNGLSFPNPDDNSGSRRGTKAQPETQPSETIADDASTSNKEAAPSENQAQDAASPAAGGGNGNDFAGPSNEFLLLTAPCLGFFAQPNLARASFDLADSSGQIQLSVTAKESGWTVAAASGHVTEITGAPGSLVYSSSTAIPATQCPSARQVVVSGVAFDLDWELDSNGSLQFFRKTQGTIESALQVIWRAD